MEVRFRVPNMRLQGKSRGKVFVFVTHPPSQPASLQICLGLLPFVLLFYWSRDPSLSKYMGYVQI